MGAGRVYLRDKSARLQLFLAGAWPGACGRSKRQGADGLGWVCPAGAGIGGGALDGGISRVPKRRRAWARNGSAGVPKPPLPAAGGRSAYPVCCMPAVGGCRRRAGWRQPALRLLAAQVRVSSPGAGLFLSPRSWGPGRARPGPLHAGGTRVPGPGSSSVLSPARPRERATGLRARGAHVCAPGSGECGGRGRAPADAR